MQLDPDQLEHRVKIFDLNQFDPDVIVTTMKYYIKLHTSVNRIYKHSNRKLSENYTAVIYLYFFSKT